MKEKITDTFIQVSNVRNLYQETGSKGEKNKNNTYYFLPFQFHDYFLMNKIKDNILVKFLIVYGSVLFYDILTLLFEAAPSLADQDFDHSFLNRTEIKYSTLSIKKEIILWLKLLPVRQSQIIKEISARAHLP